MEKPQPIGLDVGDEGWLFVGRGGRGVFLWQGIDFEDLQVHVRVERGTDDRVKIVELRLVGDIDGPTLRNLPIARMEASLNQPGLAQPLDLRIESGAEVDVSGITAEELYKDVREQRPPRMKLTVPSTFKKPDEFYQRVAVAYSHLAARSNRPAADLADRNDVPRSTAHRWVKEARRRGFLPPGQKGRGG